MTDDDPQNEDIAPSAGGFMRFYGLYWDHKHVHWDQGVMPGTPTGWIGRGKFSSNFDHDVLWMNFYKQKGVYVLYNSDLAPVYAGQAGLRRTGADEGGSCLGERLNSHRCGKYRNGWQYFSWFGFLEAKEEKELKKLRTAQLETRRDPGWEFKPGSRNQTLNALLDSFEAILIEAFTPRFNARGGNLKDAVYVDQFESVPKFIREERERLGLSQA